MKKLLIVFYFIFICNFLLAHPHIFFENMFILKITSDEIVINLNLILDEMNSLLIKERNDDYELYKNVFNNFKFNYNGKILDNKVIDKKIKFNEDNLILDIILKYQINIKKDDRLIISIYDKEYFYDYDYDNNSFDIKNNTNLKITTNFKENKKEAYYYNMIYPKEFEVVINEK